MVVPTREPTDERLGYLIKRVQQTLELTMDRKLRGLGLTTPQYAALAMLEQYPGASNAELAERCFVTPQTMHQIIVRLVQHGFVSRRPHPEHGRIQQTHLTERGEARLLRAHEAIIGIETQMGEALSTGERELAASVLKSCLEALERVL